MAIVTFKLLMHKGMQLLSNHAITLVGHSSPLAWMSIAKVCAVCYTKSKSDRAIKVEKHFTFCE